jgi:colicin import membrane protein
MPPKVKEELQVFNLDNLNPALLPELATFKAIQLKVVEDNPFVVITDTASRDLAKKYRTARVSARTALQGQDKLISSKFNEAKTKAKSYIAELIAYTQPGEIEQQKEIDRDEAEAEFKRQEKARVEQQRIDNIKKELEDYVTEWKTTFGDMIFDTIEKVSADFLESYTTYDLTVLKEFESFFPKKVEELTNILSYHTTALTEKENARLEKERMEAEAKKFAEEKAEFEAKQKAIEAENKRVQDEIQAEQNRIVAENLKISQENERKSKELAEAIAKLDAEKKQKEQEEADRIAELKAKEVTETPSPATIKGIKIEDKAIELLQNIDSPAPVEPTANVCYDLPKEPTWDSIAEDFKNSGGKSYSKWLKDNYNVPTKIQ